MYRARIFLRQPSEIGGRKLHHECGLGGMHGNETRSFREQREVAHPESDTSPMQLVVFAIGSGDGGMQGPRDETEHTVRRVSRKIDPVVFPK